MISYTNIGNMRRKSNEFGIPMIINSGKDFRVAAKRRLPRFLFDYIEGGSYAEGTLARNVSDLSSIRLRQRVLRDVSAISLESTWFGKVQALPVALGPIG